MKKLEFIKSKKLLNIDNNAKTVKVKNMDI